MISIFFSKIQKKRMRFHVFNGILFHLHTFVKGNFIQTQTDMS